MKKLFTFSFLFLASTQVNGQIREIAAGSVFNTRYPERIKIFNLDNGNTLMLRIHYDDLVNIQVYNADHKEVFSKKTDFGLKKLDDLKVYGAVELDGTDIVVFFSCYQHKKFSHYRALIDKNNGNVHDMEEFLSIPKSELKQQVKYVDNTYIGFDDYVDFIKSENGQYHAIYIKDFKQEDQQNRQRILVYNREGNKISETGVANDPKEEFDQMTTLVGWDITNHGVVYGLITYIGEDKSPKYLFKISQKGQVTSATLKNQLPKLLLDGIFRYNETTDEIFLITSKENSNNTSVTSNTIIDKEGNATTSVLNTAPANMYADKYVKKQKGNVALYPLDIILNDDGSYKMLFTNIRTITKNRSQPANNPIGSTFEVNYTIGFGYINYNRTGEINNTVYIPRFLMNYNGGSVIDDNGYFSTLTDGNARGFAFVNTEGKEYFLLNDRSKNIEHMEEGDKVVKIENKGIHFIGLSALVKDGEVVPEIEEINPDEKIKNFYYFSVNNYNQKTKEIATIKYVDGDKMQLVWLKAQ